MRLGASVVTALCAGKPGCQELVVLGDWHGLWVN